MVAGSWPTVVTFLRVFHGALTDLDEVFLPSYYHFWPRREFWPNTALVLVALALLVRGPLVLCISTIAKLAEPTTTRQSGIGDHRN